MRYYSPDPIRRQPDFHPVDPEAKTVNVSVEARMWNRHVLGRTAWSLGST